MQFKIHHITCKVQRCKSKSTPPAGTTSTADAKCNSKSTTPPAVSFRDNSQSASNSKSTQPAENPPTTCRDKSTVCKPQLQQSHPRNGGKLFNVKLISTDNSVQSSYNLTRLELTVLCVHYYLIGTGGFQLRLMDNILVGLAL